MTTTVESPAAEPEKAQPVDGARQLRQVARERRRLAAMCAAAKVRSQAQAADPYGSWPGES